jgi:AraC-like DNA-binding protein
MATLATDWQVDVLSDLLHAVRLRGAIYFDFTLAEPWVAAAPQSREVAPLLMPGVEHVIEYHVVSEGSCWVALQGHDPMPLAAGDLVAFPRGSSHVLSSTPGARGKPQLELFRRAYSAGRLPYVVSSAGRGGRQTRIVCGFLGCDARPFNPLLECLPPMIHLQARSARDGDWLASFLAITLSESKAQRAGSQNVLARMSELMFIEVVRRHLEDCDAEQTGWLAGLRDRVVGRALSLLHGRAGHAWTLEELASGVGTSRSVLAARFTALLGEPPMQYLTKWRMQLASQLLLSSNAGIAGIAQQVGYESEAAFSRAFKKLVGQPPAAWRHARR